MNVALVGCGLMRLAFDVVVVGEARMEKADGVEL